MLYMYDCDSRLQLQTHDLNLNVKYMYNCMNKGSDTKHGIDFFYCYIQCIQDRNRFLKNLKTQNSILETRNSSLETRFSKALYRGSSFESGLSNYICDLESKNGH